MRKISTALVLFAAATVGTSALSATLNIEAGNVIAGVDGIMVGGVSYDMTWSQGAFEDVGQNPPVLTNATDAEAVAQTVIDLFNTNSIERPQIKGLTCSTGDCDIVVAYSVSGSSFDAFNVDWGSTDWVLQPQTWNLDFENPIVAQAILTLSSVSAVPLPAGLPLLASAFGLLALGRRRKAA